MDLFQTQYQIKLNAEEMRYFYNDVKNWEDNMKEMDEQLRNLKNDNEEELDEEKGDRDDLCENARNEENKETAEKYKEKGNSLVKSGHWEEAVEEYDRAIELDGRVAAYYGNRAYCYLQLNQLKQAEEDCTLALKLDSKYYKVLLRRAIIRRKLGNLVDAAIDLDNLLQMNVENVAAWKEYHDLYPQLKDLNCYNILKTKLPPQTVEEPKTLAISKNVIPNKKPIPKRTPEVEELVKLEMNGPQTEENETQEVTLNKPLKQKKNFAADSLFAEITPLRTKPAHKRSKLPLKRISIEDCFK
ncbi:RNA polymerase II-associated protein 3-like [Rhodnius prolixus]|uniref:TPR_REGION domain-containing protein n=1 Tax=Rhodnius prolixus TaxID=13249 RepID=T1I320_RHOPR